MKNKIEILEQEVKILESKKDSLEGQVNLLTKQKEDLSIKLGNLKDTHLLNTKCCEFLNFIQKSNQELIKESFENIVTEALQFILGAGYKFELVFGKRGNLSELDFNIVTPEKKEPSDLLNTAAGGEIDVVSLALRIVLLSLQNPKNEGFLLGDEIFARLRGKEYLQNANKFLKVINERFNRQIILISHEPELNNNPDYNIIEIGEK